VKNDFAPSFLKPLGIFGFVITLGLCFYEIYGIRKCHALIEAGKRLECSMHVTNGQFQKRPRATLYLINEVFASGVIYPAVLAGWWFLAYGYPQPAQLTGIKDPLVKASAELVLIKSSIKTALTGATQVFEVGFAFALLYNVTLPLLIKIENKIANKLKKSEKLKQFLDWLNDKR